MARLNGGMLCYDPISLFRSTYRGGSVGLRDDVGIVPYNLDGVRSVQRTMAGCVASLPPLGEVPR